MPFAETRYIVIESSFLFVIDIYAFHNKPFKSLESAGRIDICLKCPLAINRSTLGIGLILPVSMHLESTISWYSQLLIIAVKGPTMVSATSSTNLIGIMLGHFSIYKPFQNSLQSPEFINSSLMYLITTVLIWPYIKKEQSSKHFSQTFHFHNTSMHLLVLQPHPNMMCLREARKRCLAR